MEETGQREIQLEAPQTSPTESTAIVATPKSFWRKSFEAFQGLWEGSCKALQGFCRWTLQWFLPRLLVGTTALILFGGWIQLQPLRAAANWLHPRERVNALSWCISTKEAWPSVGQAYPPGDQAPSVRIAPGIWCNSFSPNRGIATQMRTLFPDLG